MTQKWNGGVGAILCDACQTIIAYGFHPKDYKVHLCDKCGGLADRVYEQHVKENADEEQPTGAYDLGERLTRVEDSR